MRIDEIDSKHKEFKKVILNHDLTEEQLDEIVPVIGAVAGGVARAGMAAGQVAARGVGALARGVGAVARGVGQAASAVGRGIGRAGRNVSQQVKTQTKDQAKQKIKDFFTQANQDGSSSNQQTGTQGTIGTQGTQGTGQQAQLQRGQELDLPQTDPKNPNRTVPTKMKVKNVTGREVELQPSKKQPGQPNVIKYDKKDLQI